LRFSTSRFTRTKNRYEIAKSPHPSRKIPLGESGPKVIVGIHGRERHKLRRGRMRGIHMGGGHNGIVKSPRCIPNADEIQEEKTSLEGLGFDIIADATFE